MDADHQSTDLAVGDSIPRGAPAGPQFSGLVGDLLSDVGPAVCDPIVNPVAPQSHLRLRLCSTPDPGKIQKAGSGHERTESGVLTEVRGRTCREGIEHRSCVRGAHVHREPSLWRARGAVADTRPMLDGTARLGRVP